MKIIKLIKKHLKLITIISVMIISCSLVLYKYFLLQKEETHEEVTPHLEEQVEEISLDENNEVIETVFIDIKGEVAIPGVYEIEEGKKVIDVINLAGGFTEQADTSLINLAKQITNEMVIIIYSKDEVKKARENDEIIKVVEKECICPQITNDACLNKEDETANIENETIKKEDKLVNLNTASLEELQTLTGIGESKAKAIIEYREDNDGFKNIEELKEVSGIGEALYEKIKNNITV